MKTFLLVVLLCGIVGATWGISDEEILAQMQVLAQKVSYLEVENKQLQEFRAKYETKVDRLETRCGCDGSILKTIDEDLVQNATIEERVTLLELSMVEVQDEVAELEDEVAFLFDEQVIQDERILALEQETAGLDARVEVLEAGGGGGGNTTELEERVETLEGTVADHETRLVAGENLIEELTGDVAALDGRVETLEGTASDHEARLTSVESAVEDLEESDVQLDARVTALEEGAIGNATTIAFHAVTEPEDVASIPVEANVIFSTVFLNSGDGYDPTTGVFTVPSGGEGYYFLTTYNTVDNGEYAYMDIRVNGEIVCTGLGDHSSSEDFSYSNSQCNAAIFLNDGDEVTVVNNQSSDSTPLWEITHGPMNGFTGFRI